MEKDLRKIQLVELDILKKVKEICDKNNIRYFLAYGTLIGAIRHKGFIPWDDDVDIHMLAPDYLKFCKIAPKELGNDYFFQNASTDPGYHYNYGKVLKNNTTAMTIDEKGLDINWGIYIDIFPIVSCKNEEDYNRKIRLQYLYQAIINTEFRRIKNNNKTIKTKILNRTPQFIRRALADYYFKKIFEGFNPKDRMKVLKHESFNFEEFFYNDFYGEKREAEFEGIMFSIPNNAERILSMCYGDYMKLPPVEKRMGHELYGSSIIFDCEKSYLFYK